MKFHFYPLVAYKQFGMFAVFLIVIRPPRGDPSFAVQNPISPEMRNRRFILFSTGDYIPSVEISLHAMIDTSPKLRPVAHIFSC